VFHALRNPIFSNPIKRKGINPAMALLPTVGALKYRDDELLRTFEQLGEL